MSDLLDLPPVTDRPAALTIALALASGEPITRRALNNAMTAAFGGTDAEGRWTQRDSFEMLEHALALHVAKQPYPLADIAGVTHAAALMERLPTQTVRSEEQIELQQFSTPIDIGALAAVILSMPPGTPPDRVEMAARSWARETLSGRHDWIMARHDDTKHPHVHVTVRAVGYDGRRLAPGPDDLQVWRERFARELRRLGIEAEATPRQARGVVRKMPKAAIAGMERRGVDPRVRQRERQAAEHEARAPKPAQPRDWSRDIQARQDSIRRAYLDHANALERGDAADRRLARDIRRFVADMPVALTRRQALAVELRRVLDQRHGKAVPVGVSSDPTPPDKGWYRASPAFALGPAKWPRR